ncbi:MAG: ParB/RepB/Spo0J family partition protein [Candidatus Eisenbacteria bacterium]|uniref:ParB/RepB/Spo0J family partition protein n=1 Tax=Eiseniibacteriota bacterium TaxID=2212470 RepID=A0A956LX02_UNCEI|nr:ParB/RepB/Spo0J family partition protein [Candidatus Eisenbacteria bacterium]
MALEHSGEMVRLVPIEKIVPNPRQPRKTIQDETLNELADSIRERGVLEPLLVRANLDGSYELIAGERRLRAAQRAGLFEVPVLQKEIGDQASLEIALIENIQREDLNAVDEARAYQRLVDEFGRTHAEISVAVGKNRTTVTNLLRLLQLPESVLNLVASSQLTSGHARALLKVDSPEKQIFLAETIVREGWSVREVERATSAEEEPTDAPPRESRNAGSQSSPSRDPQVVRVEDALRTALGTEVRLSHTPKGGKIEIRYFSTEELERILELLRIEVH